MDDVVYYRSKLMRDLSDALAAIAGEEWAEAGRALKNGAAPAA